LNVLQKAVSQGTAFFLLKKTKEKAGIEGKKRTLLQLVVFIVVLCHMHIFKIQK